MITVLLNIFQDFLSIFKKSPSLKTSQIELIDHSAALKLLLYFFTIVYIYNTCAINWHLPVFQTGLNPKEIIASLLTTAGLVVGHNYTVAKN